VSTREEYFDVYAVYLPVAVVVFALVCGFIGVAVIRGRRRRRDPSRRKNHIPLEVAYVAVLAAITAGLLVLTLSVDDRITSARAGDRGEQIRVLAAQWHWRFEYPQHGVAVDGTDERDAVLVVPRGVPIGFAGRSLDVVHAFWVPRQRFQRELFNDRVTRFTMTFQAEDDGTSAPCSFFCGVGHPSMRFRIRVLEPAAFAAWIRERRAAR
jgi:cytochrome c oxidase subunit II